MLAPEVFDIDALLDRVAELEVAAGRRAAAAELVAGRVAAIEALLRRLVDGAEPVADARQDKARRIRALLADLARAAELGLTQRAAYHLEGILSGECPAPPGCEATVDAVLSLFGGGRGERQIWRYLKIQRDLLNC